jgi:hypothetical protein
MRCLTCHGRGWIENEAVNRPQLPLIPCPRCQGTGIDHCCDGADAAAEIDEQMRGPDQPPASGDSSSSRT